MAFRLDSVVNSLKFPCSGNNVLNECRRQNLPENFIGELGAIISDQRFDNQSDLESWFSDNLTAHMAGLLGGAAVQNLISKGRRAA